MSNDDGRSGGGFEGLGFRRNLGEMKLRDDDIGQPSFAFSLVKQGSEPTNLFKFIIIIIILIIILISNHYFIYLFIYFFDPFSLPPYHCTSI